MHSIESGVVIGPSKYAICRPVCEHFSSRKFYGLVQEGVIIVPLMQTDNNKNVFAKCQPWCAICCGHVVVLML